MIFGFGFDIGEAMGQVQLPAGFRLAHVWPKNDDARVSLDIWTTVENLHRHAAKALADRESAIARLTQ